MLFARPEILYGLFLLIIPIIIHLFNFRLYKKAYFSNLSFLKQLNQQTKKTSQLRRWLVLAARMLFLFFLILAFANPYVINQNKNDLKENKRVEIFIDNSFSMQQKAKKGVLLEVAKNIAGEISAAYKPTDRFKLLNQDVFSFGSDFVSRDDFMSDLRNTNFSPFSIPLSEVIYKSFSGFKADNTHPTDVFVISDFQKSQFDIANFKNDSNVNFWLVPLSTPKNPNIFIDSVWIDDPVITSNKLIKLKYNLSSNVYGVSQNINVKLVINGKQKGINSIELDNKPIEGEFTFMPDSSTIQAGFIEIDDYPVVFDDKFYFNFQVNTNYKVVQFTGNDFVKFVGDFFDKDSSVTFLTFSENQIDYKALDGSNLLILNSIEKITSGLVSEIENYLFQGGAVTIIPSCDNNLTSFKELVASLSGLVVESAETSKIFATHIEVQSPLFKDVFNLPENTLPANLNLPYFRNRSRLTNSSQLTITKEIDLADGNPVLVSFPFKTGQLYLFLACLDSKNSNFGKHALFIPTFYNMMLVDELSVNLYHFIDDNSVIIPNNNNNSDMPIHLVNDDKTVDYIPGFRRIDGKLQISTEGRIPESGNYFIIDGSSKYPVSFNYRTAESKLGSFSTDEIQNEIQSRNLSNFNILEGDNLKIKSDLMATDNNIALWKIFIIVSIFFLLIEVFLLKFLK